MLATGPETRERDSEEQAPAGTVTLVVTPAQAEVVAFALHMGSFHLTLRSPLDTAPVELDYYSPANFGTFRGR